MNRTPILFSYDDIKGRYPNVSSFYSFVRRSLRSHRVEQVKKGLYALVDPSTDAVYANKFQVACRLFPDAYFSYHEALEYYGLANQSFVSVFNYLCHVRVPEFEFDGILYHSKKVDHQTQVIDLRSTKGLRVVTLERTIVDCIDCPELSGGLDEVESALDYAPKLDLGLVMEMLEFYDKRVLYQKVGYLFEKHFGARIPASFYEKCLSRIGNKIVYFDAQIGRAKLNLKWRLMVRDEVWEEIDELL